MSTEDKAIDELTDQLTDMIVAPVNMADVNDPNVQVLEIDKTGEGVDNDDDLADVQGDFSGDEQWGDDDMEMGDAEENDRPALNPEDVVDTAKFTFKDHTDSVYSVAFNPVNKEEIATGGGDDRAYIVDIATGIVKQAFPKFDDSVIAVAYNFNGKLLAVGSMDGIIKIFKTKNGECVAEFSCDSDLESMSWHQAGDVLLAGTADGLVWMWDVATQTPMHTMAGHNSPVKHVQFALDGKVIISGDEEGNTFLRAAKNAKDIIKFKGLTGHKAPVLSLSQHPTQPLMATGAEDGIVHVASLANGKIVHKLDAHSASAEVVAFGPAVLPYLATASVDGTVKVWDTARACQLRATLTHPEAVTKLQWHPNLPLIASACGDGCVRLWDAKTGKQLHEFTGHCDSLLDLVFSSDGSLIATASDDKTVKVFDLAQVKM